jgi:hypothetical protein
MVENLFKAGLFGFGNVPSKIFSNIPRYFSRVCECKNMNGHVLTLSAQVRTIMYDSFPPFLGVITRSDSSALFAPDILYKLQAGIEWGRRDKKENPREGMKGES